jgi:rhodanese-related sulfurtransferase
MTNAIDFFSTRLRFQIDPSDVSTAIGSGADLVLVDSRSRESWKQGHIPGAVHMPTAEIDRRAPNELDRAVPVATYCWGPGCNGATKAALELARLGFEVREMIGGFEYWAREGLAVETSNGIDSRTPDPLTVPVASLACGC